MHDLCIFFVEKSFLTQNFLLFAEINLTTWGPLYTCLVYVKGRTMKHSMCYCYLILRYSANTSNSKFFPVSKNESPFLLLFMRCLLSPSTNTLVFTSNALLICLSFEQNLLKCTGIFQKKRGHAIEICIGVILSERWQIHPSRI